MNETKKDEVMQVEDAGDALVRLLVSHRPSPLDVLMLTFCQAKDAAQAEHNSWLNDKPRARKLRRKMDLRILPLCAWMYLVGSLSALSKIPIWLLTSGLLMTSPAQLPGQRQHRKLQATQL